MGRKKSNLNEDIEVDNEELVEVTQENKNNVISNEEPTVTAPEQTIDEGSPEWQAAIMERFTEDELVEGRPRCNGLRRVATSLFGPLNITVKDVWSINEGYAAVTVTVVAGDIKNGGRVIDGSAECSINNTDEPYNRYPLATAETRAMGRALKQLLGLNVLTAEEGSRKAEISGPPVIDNSKAGSINDTQIKFIDRICEKLNIEVLKTVSKIMDKAVATIRQLSHSEALLVNEQLNKWMQHQNSIPPELSGYNKDWRSI